MALQAADAPPPHSEALSLICAGSGTKTAYSTGSIDVFGPKGATTGFYDQTHDRPYSDNLRIEIGADGTGKVQVPQTLIPPMHGGGVDGWWTIQELKVTDDQIDGKFSFNFMNSVHLRIYRTTGAVTLAGKVTSFSGQCEKYHPETRKF